MRSKYTFLFLLAAIPSLFLQTASAQVIIRTFAGDGFGAGTGSGAYSGDGGGAQAARLNAPSAVTFDGAGNIYIADKNNHVVRKVSYTGIITTFAGTGVAGFTSDSALAVVSKLNLPYGVASDVPGNVYVTDYNNNKVRKISTTGIMTTYAGTGVAGYSGDGGPATAAKLRHPQGIAIDQFGNVYFSEADNHVVRKVSPAGDIITVAGNGTFGYSGDGDMGYLAQLYGPAGLTVDVYQNLYIADYFNNVVRRVDSDGVITTYAGTHMLGNTGDGGPATSAQLYYPSGVSIYGHGDVYISDQGNNNIRKVDEMGIISHVAGTSTNGYAGDGGPAVSAQLSSPKGLAVDGVGRVFISDYDNNVIRIVKDPTAVNNVAVNSAAFDIYPNPASSTFNIVLQATGNPADVTVMDMTGRVVATQTIAGKTKKATIDLGSTPAGNYIVKVVSAGKTSVQLVVLTK